MRQGGRMLYSGSGHRWRYGACALHAGYLRLQIHTQDLDHLLVYFFPQQNGCTDTCQCYITRELPALNAICSDWRHKLARTVLAPYCPGDALFCVACSSYRETHHTRTNRVTSNSFLTTFLNRSFVCQFFPLIGLVSCQIHPHCKMNLILVLVTALFISSNDLTFWRRNYFFLF